MQIIVTFRDRSLADYADRLEKLSAGSGRAMLAQALNQAGHAMRQATVSAETAQTGLKLATIDRAQQEIVASPGRLAYTISSHGGNVREKFFGAQETGSGVTAHPWNRSQFTQGGFIKAGGFGGPRVDLPWGGEVKKRKGSARLSISTVRSGLYIPTEMVKGQTASAYHAGAEVAVAAIVSRLGALLP